MFQKLPQPNIHFSRREKTAEQVKVFNFWKVSVLKRLGKNVIKSTFYLSGEKESRGGNRPLGKRQKSRRETAKAGEKEEELTIPEEARLCSDVREVEPLTAEEAMVCADVPEDTPPAAEVSEDQKPVISGLSVPVCLKVIGGNGYELVEKDPKTVSPEMLEVFQARQKMLEEQNRRRKEMLAKVLEDRYFSQIISFIETRLRR